METRTRRRLRLGVTIVNICTDLEKIKQQKPNMGHIDCPVCGNKLDYARQFNGHVWGKCKTENCLSWMQ